MRTQLLLTLLLTAALLTACTRERATPEPTATPAETAAPTRTSSEPVVETVSTSAATPTATAAGTATPEAGVSSALIQYTVQGGDTIGSIAAQFRVTEQQLRELNNLPNDDIFAGQILRVPEGEPTPTPEPFKHVVQPGETLTTIAARYGVNFLTLVEVNGLESPDTLAEGTELLIPGVTAPTASGDATTEGGATSTEGAGSGGSALSAVTHIVQPGETLSTIAADYGIDATDLAAANNLTNPNMLRAGQQLIIPGVTQQQAVEARGIRHTVASGESLSQIAQTYGVTIEQIMAVNGLDDPNTIVVGQELVIPQ